LGITVAALMHVDWIGRKLTVDANIDRVILPGWCQGDVGKLNTQFGRPVERGPKDLHELPEFLGHAATEPPDLSRFDIEILAEINHAPRLADTELLAQASRYRDNGADVIDLGCIPGESWSRAGDVTKLLRAHGFRVSIDSYERAEVEAAVAAGAELVLSCNSSNRDWAAALAAEVVAVPDDAHTLAGLDDTIAHLDAQGTRYRIDPILEPIGFGFAASLGRYIDVRRRWPSARMMMGIGNLTELTEVDSAGINMLLAGFCQELGIHSVLTTEVINWCRSAVREFDLARRLACHSVRQQVLPKHVDAGLVMLRDSRLREMGEAELEQLAAQIRDPNFRVFAERGEIHLISRDGYWHGSDPYALFDQLPPVDPQHAFYLGYELAKAVTALTLGKNFVQDEPLNWGFLTRPETSALHRRLENKGPGESE
jgi:dihydropteroate synthase-like protein